MGAISRRMLPGQNLDILESETPHGGLQFYLVEEAQQVQYRLEW